MEPGGARWSQERPERPGGARWGQEEPGAARWSQEEPGGARWSQVEPGGARRRQEKPGGPGDLKTDGGFPRSSCTSPRSCWPSFWLWALGDSTKLYISIYISRAIKLLPFRVCGGEVQSPPHQSVI